MGREVVGLIKSSVKDDSCVKPRSLETPYTPNLIGESMVMNLQSGLLSPPSEASVVVFSEADKNDGSIPRTPKEDVFDSFSPGSDHLLHAPMRKKHRKESHGKILRGLYFGLEKKDKINLDGAEPELEDEKSWVRDLYGDLLEVIAYGQAEEAVGAFPEELDDGSDASSPSTDSCLPVFSTIAETCPAAPMKIQDDDMKTSSIVDSNLCKKLEF